jgi:uncharacterized protein YaiI (UPF0178 family)
MLHYAVLFSSDVMITTDISLKSRMLHYEVLISSDVMITTDISLHEAVLISTSLVRHVHGDHHAKFRGNRT